MAHHIKELLRRYDEAYHRKFGVRALIGAKEAALAKRLLSRYTLDQLGPWVDHFFDMADPFIEQSGYGFGVFSSCLGKVIADRQPQPVRLSARTARSLKAIYGDE